MFALSWEYILGIRWLMAPHALLPAIPSSGGPFPTCAASRHFDGIGQKAIDAMWICESKQLHWPWNMVKHAYFIGKEWRYACMHASIHSYFPTSLYTYHQTYIHACIHTYLPTCIHTYIHACMHTYLHTYMHACIPTYMHACIHTYLHTCMHTYLPA